VAHYRRDHAGESQTAHAICVPFVPFSRVIYQPTHEFSQIRSACCSSLISEAPLGRRRTLLAVPLRNLISAYRADGPVGKRWRGLFGVALTAFRSTGSDKPDRLISTLTYYARSHGCGISHSTPAEVGR
jgi:hypothetical protein